MSCSLRDSVPRAPAAAIVAAGGRGYVRVPACAVRERRRRKRAARCGRWRRERGEDARIYRGNSLLRIKKLTLLFDHSKKLKFYFVH
jgi:hypothetical protein